MLLNAPGVVGQVHERIEVQFELQTIQEVYTHPYVKTGKAYELDLGIWGKGSAPKLKKNDEPRLSQVEDLTDSSNCASCTINQLSRGLEARDARLSGDQRAMLAVLKRRDRAVRSHEQAHIAAGGGVVVGGPNLTFQRGPDGILYAIGGSVNIDTSPLKGNPEGTIAKMRQVRRAALAPSDPSSDDKLVAGHASATESQARLELAHMLVAKRQEIELAIKRDQRNRAEKAGKTGEREPESTRPTQAQVASQAYSGVDGMAYQLHHQIIITT